MRRYSEVIKNKTLLIADYILYDRLSFREIEKRYKIRKSTAHYYVKKYLHLIDREKSTLVQSILNEHFAFKHIKAGEATRRKHRERVFGK